MTEGQVVAMAAERIPVGDLFTDLRARSRAALEAGVRWRSIVGVNAVLVIVIPDDPRKPCEIAVFTGPVTMSVDSWKMTSER